MNYFKISLVTIFLITLWSCTPKSGQSPQAPTEMVSLSAPVEFNLQAGESANIQLQFTIKSDHHIMANAVSGNFIATELELHNRWGIQFGAFQFSEAMLYTMPGSDMNIAVFEGKFSIDIPVTANRNATAGSHLLNGRLYYQLCDDNKCYFPSELTFPLIININTYS